MKVITEARIRAELKATKPEVYYIPEGKLLSPAAREYLQQLKIAIEKEGAVTKENKVKTEALTQSHESEQAEVKTDKKRYVDYESGAIYEGKPEYMTQLFGNKLVDKTNGRIAFRGKLDKVQAEIVIAQTLINNAGERKMLNYLDDILKVLREMMRCEVLDEPFEIDKIIGMTFAELREHSHNPMKYYKIEYMSLPSYEHGMTYAQLNLLRTSIRELEVIALNAFKNGREVIRKDILTALNRLSSAMHILMCMYQSESLK